MVGVADNTLFSYRLDSEKPPFNSSHPFWRKADKIAIDHFWDDRSALDELSEWNNLTRISSRWSETAIFLFFECWFENLYVFDEVPRGRVNELWERDVAEAFLQPVPSGPYFEFEVSPLGQWLDLRIFQAREDVDPDWRSGMKVSCLIDEDAGLWESLLEIPFQPLLETVGAARSVKTGDTWRANFFRIAGLPPAREYLSWQATNTARPDFHAPEAFGHLIFVEEPV